MLKKNRVQGNMMCNAYGSISWAFQMFLPTGELPILHLPILSLGHEIIHKMVGIER